MAVKSEISCLRILAITDPVRSGFWLQDREIALAKRHSRELEKLNEHVKKLPPLEVGDCVLIQNQTGSRPLKWDKTGRIVEANGFNQYTVRFDGSGRCSKRNRKFLRKIQPVMNMTGRGAESRQCSPQGYLPRYDPYHPQPTPTPAEATSASAEPTPTPAEATSTLVQPTQPDSPHVQSPARPSHTQYVQSLQSVSAAPEASQSDAEGGADFSDLLDPSVTLEAYRSPSSGIPPAISSPSPEVRRTGRERKPKQRFSPQLRGKSHKFTEVSNY